MRRAKIVCTLGPTSDDPQTITRLIQAGMNVARLNFSHGTHEDHRCIYGLVRQVAAEQGCAVAVLQDLQGPKIRVGRLPGGQAELRPGQEVSIITEEGITGEGLIPCSYTALPRDVDPGDRILLDDGRMELQVLEAGEERVRCQVVVGGTLQDRKGINLPGVKLSTPSVTEKDLVDLALGVELGVDYVALSFVRSPDDIEQAKQMAGDIPVIAKIEKPEAVERFDEILEQADGIMVARGDLGVELGPERVPLIQKRLIEQTNEKAKVVITATEMLDSMRVRPRPTRAEASDVANAILDGTDAVMLSGETASGEYPIEAVQTMDRIIREIEASPRYRQIPQPRSMHQRETTNAVARAAVAAAEELEANTIISYTESGATALLISEYRPRAAILAVTANPAVYHRLALHWGVVPLQVDSTPSTDEMLQRMVDAASAAGLVSPDEVVVLTMGTASVLASDVMKIHRV